MIYEYFDKVRFGQYEGLTIQEIYQGSFNINAQMVSKYLSKILNSNKDLNNIFPELELIDNIIVDDKVIKVIGDIHNNEKPLCSSNRIIFGNIEEIIENYINQYFNPNFLGILNDIRVFNKEQPIKSVLGGDPEYLKWCIKTIESFDLSEDCKKYLNGLSVTRLKGISLMYIGDEQYEYCLKIEIERRKKYFSVSEESSQVLV